MARGPQKGEEVMKLKPPKGLTRASDLWKYYLCESIQQEAHCWDSRRILDLLGSPSTACFYVDRRPSWSVDYLVLEITGNCYDGIKTIEVTLYRSEMTEKEKAELRGHVLSQYPKISKTGGNEAHNFNVRKHVAKVMKMEQF